MIKKIILKVGGKEVGVTVKEARKLYDDLGELFYEPYINPPTFPATPWQTPVWPDAIITTTSDGISVEPN